METVLPSGNSLASPLTSKHWAVQIGKVWFRYRSFSPLPFFILLIALPAQFRLGVFGYLFVGAIVAAAEGLRIWAVGYAGSVTRTRGDTVPRLIHAGPYRYLRNPLYVANIAMYIGAGVMFGFGWLSLVFFIYFCVQYTFIVRYEESILINTFGAPYAKFFAEVPRWGIRLRPYESSGHPFDLKAALRSERSTFYSLSGMAIGFALKRGLLS